MQGNTRQRFALIFMVIGLATALLAVAVFQLRFASHAAREAGENRYQSFLLANQLRQDSQDLTRMVRTYTVTGDAKWESQYLQVVDIQDGKAARPEQYQRIYWDFLAVSDQKPRPDGEPVALMALMKQVGLTPEEEAKLAESKQLSDALIAIETQAMNLVKGLQDDGKGGTRQGAPDLEKARKLVHDQVYHQEVAKIMRPLDEFFAMLDERTQATLDRAEARQSLWQNVVSVLVALILMLLALAAWMQRQLFRLMGGEPAYAVEMMHRAAQGELSLQINTRSGDEASVLYALKNMLSNLSAMVGEVRQGADALSMMSSQINATAQSIAQAASEQAASVEQTSASMEQMSASISQNTENAQVTDAIAQRAAGSASDSGIAVSETLTAMRQIAGKVSAIDEIAYQTNLLALNAAIEAGRAGEQGKGFAVVASEVRKLAENSQAAAKQIGELVQQSLCTSERAGSLLEDMVPSIRRTADLVQEIACASNEQSSGAGQISGAMGQLSQVNQRNAAAAEELSATAVDMAEQAARLQQQMAFFR